MKYINIMYNLNALFQTVWTIIIIIGNDSLLMIQISSFCECTISAHKKGVEQNFIFSFYRSFSRLMASFVLEIMLNKRKMKIFKCFKLENFIDYGY